MPAAWGIDIGNAFVKIGKLSGKNLQVLSAFANPLGKVQIDTEQEMTTMATELKKHLTELKVDGKQFKVVIPDSLVFFRVISLPLLTEAELASAIRWEAEQYVPVKLEQVELSWDVIERPKEKAAGEKMQVLLVAAVKDLVAKAVELLGRCDLEAEAIEPELIAASRALVFGRNYTDGSMVVCIGASGMSMASYVGEKLVFVYHFGSGGSALTRSIASGLQLSPAQAEEYKRAYGVQEGVLEGKLLAAMAPVTEGMISEIKKAMSFFAQNNPSSKMSRIIIYGGVALMPGWIQLLSSKLGIEVLLGDPLQGLTLAAESLRTNATLYSGVIGTLKE